MILISFVLLQFELNNLGVRTKDQKCHLFSSEDVLSTEMIFTNYLAKLRQLPLEGEDDSFNMGRGDQQQVEELSPILKVQTDVALILQPFFSPDGLVAKSLEFAATQVPVLESNC